MKFDHYFKAKGLWHTINFKKLYKFLDEGLNIVIVK